MKKFYLITYIVFLLLLSGCVKQHSDLSSNEKSNINLIDITRANHLYDICSSDTGTYIALENNIAYFDWHSKETVFLCNRPECLHNNESCTSYVCDSYIQNIFLNPQKNKLFFSYKEDYSKLGTKIMMSDINGEDKKLVFEANSSQNIDFNIIFSDDSFYFIMDEFSVENKYIKKFIQVNYHNNECYTIFETDKNLQILSCFNDKVLFLNTISKDVFVNDNMSINYEIIMYDMETKEEKIISKYTSTRDNQESFSFAKDYYLYEFERIDSSKAEVYRTDLRNNTKKLFIEEIPFYNLINQNSVTNFYDDKFNFYTRNGFPYQSDFKEASIIIDVNTGKKINNELSYYSFLLEEISSITKYKNRFEEIKSICGITPLPIVASTNSEYITITSDTTKISTIIDGNSLNIDLPFCQATFEIISKEDYFSNKEYFVRIR